MSFSPAWLALREPADSAARNQEALAACAQHFAGRADIKVCDLGAGTGSSLRAFAELLPPTQHWTLVDHDAGNLAAARAALAAWADEATDSSQLVLKHGGKTITVQTTVRDFAQAPVCWPETTDLVTASALFDLASAPWIARFTAALCAQKIPLLATLTANETITAVPSHPLDTKVIAAFHAHQTSDKGFGPSAGAQATAILEQSLKAGGYTLTTGDSPWRLAPSELLRATTEGMAAAVSETKAVAADDLAAWLNHQREKTSQLTIGHRDVFARP